jgi:predicted nucleic acid-binding protein
VKQLVVDASVALKWVLRESDSEIARSIVGKTRLLAPDLLWAELGSALWRRQRAGDLSAVDARELLLTLRRFPVETYPLFPLLPLALEIAVAIGHSVYDCIYLALADRQDCRVLTADRRLCNVVATGPMAASVVALTDVA